MAFTALAFAQGQASLTGTVLDPDGRAVPDAPLSLTAGEGNGIRRTVRSDSGGRYAFPHLKPGSYRLEIEVPAFKKLTFTRLHLPAGSNVLFDVRLTLGPVTSSLTVDAVDNDVTLDDASIGNAIRNTAVLEIPTFARSVASLLAYQPGVTQFNSNPNATQTDSRNGAVNGGKSDQANITLDGADVNDQMNRYAFTSVLRVPLDSLQEFRTVTTNAGADRGRSSGAQVSLVTKSGTNGLHGSLYEYYRGSQTAANDWFNNSIGLERPGLRINLFGGSVGGKILKDRLFYFANYEGRRDSSSYSATRIVPSALYRQGILQYTTTAGAVAQLTPAQVQQLDPLGIGVNRAVVAFLQSYPLPNGNVAGDGLNTQSYRFSAPTSSFENTYLTRFDYLLDPQGKNLLFVRAQMQNDRMADISPANLPQFPGQPDNSVLQDNSKGLVLGWTSVISSRLVSNFNYGFTRQAYTNNGVRNGDLTYLPNLDAPTGLTSTQAHKVPVGTVHEDLSWLHGAHTVQVGFVYRNVDDASSNNGSGYSTSVSNPDMLAVQLPTPANLGGSRSQFLGNLTSLVGIVPSEQIIQNYTIDGVPLPKSATIRRNYTNREYEWYLQDTYRLRRNVIVTAGVRHSVMPPVFERDGVQLSTNIPLHQWSLQRASLAAQGLPQSQVQAIAFEPVSTPGARPLYPTGYRNFAPRLAIAYSPDATWLGGPGKTTFRAGAGTFYDLIGRGILALYDGSEPGLANLVRNPGYTQTPETAPRFTSSQTSANLVPAATPITFPFTIPDKYNFGSAIDDQIKPPYTVNLDFAVNHDFGHGLSLQTAYVGRLSRRSLALTDLAAPTNLRDSQSGQTYFQAAQQIVALLQANTPVSKVQPIPFWQNLWPGAAGNGLTATQGIYQTFQEHAFGMSSNDYSNVLLGLDGYCVTACSALGPNTMYNPQFAGLTAWSSAGRGSYNALQVSVRKQFSSGLMFDGNYTYSKSIDYTSNAERENGVKLNFRNLIPNSWSPSQSKGVSDYDVTHVFSGYAFWQVPIGRGKAIGSNMIRVADAVLGGWELAPTVILTSGLPASILNDNYSFPTNNYTNGYATWTGAPVKTRTTKTGAGPNLFPDPAAAAAAFTFTLPGESGNRNSVRGDGNISMNLGIYKRFRLPWSDKQTLQFRAEAYNLSNSVRFDVNSLYLSAFNLGPTSLTFTNPSFGKYSSTLTTPRQIQLALRYIF